MTWTRATHDTLCGGCQPPRQIRVGEPVLVISIPGVKGIRIRCQHCEEAPPDLPAVIAQVETAEQVSVFTAAQDTFARIHRRHLLRTIPLLVEREPGEEG